MLETFIKMFKKPTCQISNVHLFRCTLWSHSTFHFPFTIVHFCPYASQQVNTVALWYFDNHLLPHVQTLQLSAVKAQQIDFILYIRSKIANHSGTLIPHSCQTFPFCVGLHGTRALMILQGQNDVCAGWRVQGSLWLPSGLQGSSVLIDFDHWLEVNIVLSNWKTREPANRALPGKADVFKLQTFNKCWNKHLKTPNSQQKRWVFNSRLSQQYRNVCLFVF